MLLGEKWRSLKGKGVRIAREFLPRTGLFLSILVVVSAEFTGPAAAQDVAIVKSIVQESFDNTTRLRLVTGRKADVKVGRLSNPLRIYFDLIGVALRPDLIGQSIQVDHPPVVRVRFGINRPGVARIVFDLEGAVEHRAFFLSDEGELVIEVIGVAEEDNRNVVAAPSVAAPASPSIPPSVGPEVRQRPSIDLRAVSHTRDQEGVQVTVSLSEIGRFKLGNLENPNRCYVDLYNTRVEKSLSGNIQTADVPLLRQIRVGQFTDSVGRVVLDLEPNVHCRVSPRRDSKQLVIGLSEVGEPEIKKQSLPPEPAAVKQSPLPEAEVKKPGPLPEPAANRQRSAPEVAAPEVVAPEVAAPEVVAPEVAAPEVVAPEVAPALPSVPEGTSAPLSAPDSSERSSGAVSIGKGTPDYLDLRLKPEWAEVSAFEPEARPHTESGTGLSEKLETSPEQVVVAAVEPEPEPEPLAGPEPETRDELGGEARLDPLQPVDDVPVDETVVLDEVVARVNQEFITLSDLRRELLMLKAELEEQVPEEEKRRQLYSERKRRLLKELVERKLLVLRADEKGLDPLIDQTVEQFLNNVVKNAGLQNQSELAVVLQGRGTSLTEYRSMVKEELRANSVIRDEVFSRVTVLEVEVEKYYRDHTEEFLEKAAVELAEIFFPSAGKSVAEVRQEAELRLTELQEGASFEELAKSFSQGPTAAKGGTLGRFEKGAMEPKIEEVVFALEEGQLTPVLEVKGGMQILKVIKKISPDAVPYETVADQIRQKLARQKAENQVEGYLEDLVQKNFVYVYPKYWEEYDTSFISQ